MSGWPLMRRLAEEEDELGLGSVTAAQVDFWTGTFGGYRDNYDYGVHKPIRGSTLCNTVTTIPSTSYRLACSSKSVDSTGRCKACVFTACGKHDLRASLARFRCKADLKPVFCSFSVTRVDIPFVPG